MSNKLNALISELPEVYQTIFGHSEWDKDASRNCNERLDKIYKVYSVLSQKLGRPLKVLDLGCAQGFFSLSLASKGAVVQGIDFLDKNIAVCQALAAENPEFDIQFETGRIEDIVNNLQPKKYDLVIGLSVFHHLVHEHGVEEVKELLFKLTDSVHAVILELAVKEEPLYWAPSLPEFAYELIEKCSFYKNIAKYKTHLSNVSRPMYVVSNDYLILDDYCEHFTSYTRVPYKTATAVHEGSRRYYSNADVVCKFYCFEQSTLSSFELERSKKELNQEIAFLNSPPAGFFAPKLLSSGFDADDGWVVMERLQGELLLDKLNKDEEIDPDSIISGLLNKLVILEKSGYYHDDIRLWNILLKSPKEVFLIDYGSISKSKNDCVWPDNIFLSFILFVKELIVPQKISQGILRSASLSPYDLPGKYANWIYAFWKTAAVDWSFELLSELFEKVDDLPDYQQEVNGAGEWIKAQEKLLMNNQSHVYKLIVENEDSRSRIIQIENHIANGLEPNIESLSQHDVNVEQNLTLINERMSSVDEKMKFIDAQLGMLNNSVIQSAENTCVLLSSYQELLSALESRFESRFNESLHSVNEFKDSFELALTDIRQNFVSKEKNQDSVLEEMSHATLIEKVKELQVNNAFLANENNRLHHHIAAMTGSSSWRVTSVWRRGGHYVRLIKTNSTSNLVKKLIKKITFKSFIFINKRPKLKLWVVKYAHKTGLYNKLFFLYKCINPTVVQQTEQNINVNETITAEHCDLSQLPSRVKEIYRKLKR